MKLLKKRSSAIAAVILAAMLLLQGLGQQTAAVLAQELSEPIGNLADYATVAVGETEEGWIIKSSVNPQAKKSRAIGNSGVKVSKVYGGYTSYTEILSVVSDEGKTSIAYCVQPELEVPNNTDYRQQIFNNDQLRTVLYYGYGGNDSAEFMALEGGNVNNAYMDTWMAVRAAYNGGAYQAAVNDPMVQWLLNHASAPATRFEVGGSLQTAGWNADAMRQETGWYTTSGGGSFSLNLEGTGLSAELSDGRVLTGNTADIAAGTSFRLLAGPDKAGEVSLDIPTTATGYAGMIFVPTVDASRQSVVAGYGGDPASPARIQAQFSRREEKSQVVKLDVETGETSQGDASLDGAVFGLYAQNGDKLAEGTVSKGIVEFPAQLCGDYYIQEIAAGTGYLLDDTKYPLHLNDPGTTAVVEAKNRVKKGAVKLKKLAVPNDEQNEDSPGLLNPLAGAEFTLSLKADPQTQYIKVTDEAGELTFGDIPYGHYTLKETKTPAGYIGAAIVEEVFVSEDGQVLEYFFGNRDFYADLTVVKKDSEDGKPVALKGARFKVYDVAEGDFVTQYPASHLFMPVREWTTDSQGRLGLDKPLPAGHYILVETQAPAGYLAYQGGEESVSFEVDGERYTGIPFVLNEGSCTVVETSEKSYYAYEQSLANAPAKGRIRVEKTGEMPDGVTREETEYGTLTTFNFAQKALAGVTFEVYAAEDILGASDGEAPRVYHHSGEKVAEITTDAEGIAETGDLYLGKYRVVEKSAPAGFVLDSRAQDVELTYAGEQVMPEDNVVTLSLENAKQQAVFTLKKNEEALEDYTVGEDGSLRLIKKQQPANGITFGVFTAAPMADGRGGTVPADSLVSVKTVADGETATTENFPAGDYYYKELETRGDLVLDTNKYPIAYRPEGNASVIVLRANDGKAVVNSLFTKEYTLLKTERRGGKPLAGAEIGFYDADQQLICTQVTDDEGKIVLPELAAGQYYYRELKAPQGYVRDETLYSFEIVQDGKLSQDQLDNDLAMGTLTLEKTGEDLARWQVKDGQTVYETTGISGAEFLVTAGEDIVTADGVLRAKKGDVVAHMVTGEDGRAALQEAWFMTEDAADRAQDSPVDLTLGEKTSTENIAVAREEALFNGLYEVTEYKAPAGMVLDDTVYKADLSYVDDTTPLVEIEAIKPFNRAAKGDVLLSKTDVSTGAAIPGTKITLYDAEGKKLYTGISDDQGSLKVSGLPAGDYYFQEEGAAEGYILDDTPVKFTIREDGDIVKCQMTNRRAENPGTGVDYSGPFLAGCIALMVMAAGGAGIYQKRKYKG
ncbi:MAG: SpaA isopeptide-forming pilin-related protein [Eubacterium sp.]|nr:SpaA isopeptide-forming pilin-related protein [Eubacterium sp.]